MQEVPILEITKDDQISQEKRRPGRSPKKMRLRWISAPIESSYAMHRPIEIIRKRRSRHL